MILYDTWRNFKCPDPELIIKKEKLQLQIIPWIISYVFLSLSTSNFFFHVNFQPIQQITDKITMINLNQFIRELIYW
jgi:hypothetical protein